MTSDLVRWREDVGVAVAKPCRGRHCLCIDEGIPARKGGLILVVRRCCRCEARG